MARSGGLRRLTEKVRGSLRRGSGRSTPTEPAADHSATGGIDVSYDPRSNGRADPGEVVWTWVPYEDDPSQGKDRPVLVLGRAGEQLAVVPLSTKDHRDRRDAHEWVEVGRGGWDPKFRISYADAKRLLRVSPSAVRREGAALDVQAFAKVLERVEQIHGWER